MNTGNYKDLCFYSVTICGVTTHMYYKCQSNPDSYMVPILMWILKVLFVLKNMKHKTHVKASY